MGRPAAAAVRQINEAMGAAIANARKARKWSQTQLGEAVGREQGTVSDWEKGKSGVDLPYIRAIEDALGCGKGDLYVAAGLVQVTDDIVDRIRRETSIEDARRTVLIEIVEGGRRRQAADQSSD